MKKICIAGFGAAAFAALSTLKRLGCRDKIIIIDPKSCDLIHPCGLPYSLENKVEQHLLEQEISLERMGASKIRGTLSAIDSPHSVIVATADSEVRMSFDTLLIATGSSPVIPPIINIDRFLNKGVFTLTSVTDLEKITAWIRDKQTAVVIGAGAIGLETASALAHRGLSVTVLEMKDTILPGVLDPDMADDLQKSLSSSKITIKTSTTVTEFIGENVFEGVRFSDGEIKAELCILATGVSPNIQFAQSSSLHMMKTGIVTDDFLRSNVPHIFAAGDCASTRSAIDGKPINAKLATSAYNQGVITAYNIFGLEKEYSGSTGTFVSVIGNYEVAGTGFITHQARERGFDPVIAKIPSRISPDYFHSDEKITIKV
ncbi:MAG TPA: FAD-dependent oxidoreductase, partial [Spirochaetota bacterium]